MSKLDYTAKLLATENISIRQVGQRTAAFDVVNRVLFLPAWKDMSKDLYDLMVGHEVGHALFTPADGWHESDQEFEFPRAYVNIIEDIRIERMVQNKYPGLRGPFKRGYMELLDRDFFGTKDRHMATFGFMDRLNIKSKGRDLVDVPFTEEEVPYVKLAMSVETFDDVLKACAEIYKWLQEEKENECKGDSTGMGKNQSSDDELSDQELSGNAPSTNSDSEEGSSESNGAPSNKSKEQDGDSSSEGEADSPKGDGEGDKESNKDSEQDDLGSNKEEAQGGKGAPKPLSDNADADEVETDEAYRSKQDELLDTDNRGYLPTFCEGLSDAEVSNMIIPNAEVLAERENVLNEKSVEHPEAYAEILADYESFMDETKKVVNTMAKEFEMRKAAYQHSRAQESKSGALDVTKLHNYKFTDDLFLRTTNLADAKSHGIVAFIDFSGSMHGVISNVVHQAIVLATFCRKVGIPFDIYSFTTPTNAAALAGRTKTEQDHVSLESASMIQQLSSSMNKNTFTRSVKTMFFAFHESNKSYWAPNFGSQYDHLGGTPLNECLIAAHTILKKFKMKHGVQKVNLVTITDGDSHQLSVNNGTYYPGRVRIKLGRTYRTVGYGREITKNLLQSLRDEGYNLISYFIIDRVRDLKYKTYYENNREEIMKDFRKNKVVAMRKDFGGYDSYFFIDGRQDAATDEFEVSDNAKKGEIARAFKKFAKSKKTNRTLAVKFAEAIA